MNIKSGVDVGFEEESGRFYLVKNSNGDPIEKWRGIIRINKKSDKIIKDLRGYGIESIE